VTRYPRKLVESRSAERNRLLKLLETANIKELELALEEKVEEDQRFLLSVQLRPEGSHSPRLVP
jgi:hypothetical protein